MKLIFGSSNKNKVTEIQKVLPDGIVIQTIGDLGYTEDIPETADTIEGNAILKAQFVHDKWNENCFADDSGLIIEALNGEPGVYSARYAGKQRSDEDNINKVLHKLGVEENRKANFVTVIALYWKNKLITFQGEIKGTINYSPKGNNGFGYDPIFVPENYEQTFAEMSLEDKSLLSHRAAAISKMVNYIQTHLGE